jgi:hypothetical protein
MAATDDDDVETALTLNGHFNLSLPPSCPDLIRASKDGRLDGRVKPDHDGPGSSAFCFT